MSVQTCFEEQNLTEYGFIKKNAYLKNLPCFNRKKLQKWKARDCNCVEMVDIGDYNSCPHGCKYCYANYDETKVKSNIKKHDAKFPLF